MTDAGFLAFRSKAGMKHDNTRHSCDHSPSRGLGQNSAFLIAVLPGLVACQTAGPPPVSLEEAKKITATFEESYFVPPPRTINDITKILELQRNVKNPHLEKLRAEVNAQPPVNDDKIKLWRFYLNRGLDERVLAVLFHKGVGHPSRESVASPSRGCRGVTCFR